MQNEDDLRGLAKVTDFMRAISFLFMAIHIYWFCYGWLHEMGWTLGIVDKILSNFQRTTGLFSSLLYTKLFCVLFLGLSCMGNKGVKKHEITWRKIIIAAIAGAILFFLNWRIIRCMRHTLYHDIGRRLFQSVGIRIVDKPSVEEQFTGGRFQYWEWIVHAGNSPYGKRIFRQSTDQILVQREDLQRIYHPC